VSKGFLLFAQNTDSVDYITQAYALALSIKFSQHEIKNISLVTNDKVPKKYQKVFDQIIPIPWFNEESKTVLKGEHRWKLYHATPYDETIVLDSDMLLLEDIETWWNYCGYFDMRFCNRVKNYKLEVVEDTINRKAFIANNLSNPYFALHYFKKTDTALEFYKTLEFVCKNWEWFWGKFAPEEYQNWSSMDLATAITIEILLCHDQVFDVNSPLEFIHMKSSIQGWDGYSDKWTNSVFSILNTKGDMVIANIKQSKILHYVEKDFISDSILKGLKELAHDQG
jgi:hypothetical protein